MPKNENTLKRGQACLHCRKRKARCDGAKPTCLPCVRGNHQCVYVDTSALSTTRRRDKVSDLQERIRDLENKLASQHLSSNTSFEDITTVPYFEFSPQDPSLGISDWPYPPIDLTLHLIQVFFTCCQVESSHLHKPTLLHTALLPINHPEAPHPALMYAIFASASRHTLRTTNPKASTLNEWEYTYHGTGNTFLEMSMTTAANYVEVESKSSSSLRHKLKSMSAIIILIHLMHRENKWPDLYRFNILGIRGMVGFKMHLDERLMNPRSRMLVSCQSDLEREQRKRCLFLAFLFDTLYASITNTLPSNLDSRNIYIRLPVPTDIFNQATNDTIIPEFEPFSYSSSLFSNHSSNDNFHCLIKSTILLDKVNIFLHKSIGELLESSLSSSNQLPSFNELDKTLVDHNAGLPDYWNGNESSLNIMMYFAHMIVHKGIMELHNGYFREPISRKRLIGSVRAIINPLYTLLNISFDFSRLPSFVLNVYVDAFFILIAAHKNSDESAKAPIVKELGIIVETTERISEKLPHGVGALKNLNQSLRENGISLGKFSDMIHETSPTGFNTIMQQISSFDVAAQLGEGVSDTATTSTFGIPQGMTFAASDEFSWMNFDVINDDLFDTAIIDEKIND